MNNQYFFNVEFHQRQRTVDASLSITEKGVASLPPEKNAVILAKLDIEVTRQRGDFAQPGLLQQSDSIRNAHVKFTVLGHTDAYDHMIDHLASTA